jgi:hypothetical protein
MRMSTTAGRRHDDVTRWRRSQLVKAGVAPGLAAEVAGDRRYDVHALIELVERGCAPELAVRILAPIDEDAPCSR